MKEQITDQHAPLSYHGARRVVWLVFLLVVVWLILRAGTDNFAVRAGPTSCDGPEPDRGLAAETSHPRFISVILLMLALFAVTTTIILLRFHL
jgi:hypothetical protein